MNIAKYSGGERRTMKQREEAVNEERSNAGGHWHPFAGTLACQVVGFTLEPLGFALKRLRWLEGSYSWLQSGSHCVGHWREGKGWMNGGKTRGIRRGGHRESSKWFQGAGPTCRKRWVSGRMLLCTEGAWKGSTNCLSPVHCVESYSYHFLFFLGNSFLFLKQLHGLWKWNKWKLFKLGLS